MVYVAISRDNRRTPIDQTSPTGVPLFSRSSKRWRRTRRRPSPPTIAAIHRSLRDLPAGEYWMQPFVNVYTRFPRADGHTVWLHNDQWEGQDWKRSPGNLFGDPVKVAFDPEVHDAVRLVATRAIPPIQVPADTAW